METAASETGTETGTGTGRNVDVTMFVVPHQLYSVVARVLQPRQTWACSLFHLATLTGLKIQAIFKALEEAAINGSVNH
jgi:hypothetical protein